MCMLLGVTRSSVYYHKKPRQKSPYIDEKVHEIFNKSRKNYGTRKIKVELSSLGIVASRRRIGESMKRLNLVSNYTKRNFKNYYKHTSKYDIENIVDRKFDNRRPLEVLVSDLTYVRMLGKWIYICLVTDLSNREIVAYSCGKNKDAELVSKALHQSNINFKKVKIFHTDRGKGFVNTKLDEFLNAFKIQRSLSQAGSPHDNAVSESLYSILKTELLNNLKLESMEHLEMEMFDYVNWYNNFRIHSSLGYKSPADYKNMEAV